jgi:hypothetical protein
MLKRHLSFLVFSLLLAVNCLAQTAGERSSSKTNITKFPGNELKGTVLDSVDRTPLPYASILALHKNKGTISNENGEFALDIMGLETTDTLCFQYIGYKPEKILLEKLESSSTIYLREEIYNLNETFIFGNAPDAKTIVKLVIKNKEANYRPVTSEWQAFIRQRDITDFESFHLNYKNSTIPDLDEETLKQFEEKMPKYTTSYTDFLGNIYVTKNLDDSVKLKVEPIRTVSLKEKDFDELQKYDTLLENLFKTDNDKEYWKIKSGIFGQKVDIPEDSADIHTDTVNANKPKLVYFSRNIGYQLKYSLLDDKDEWEFLYETGKYDYTLAGGTSFNGEDVYIIDFVPHNSGNFTGRLYISVETYALIRADYEYAPGKTGRDIHLLGVGYTENEFSGSIYFEKKDSNYIVKYFSKKTGAHASVDRNLEISKKKKRVLWDKELMDFEISMEITVNIENSIEFYALDDKEITEDQFLGFTQPEFYEIIYVDQFDDRLWSGYSIIEPTQKMKDYRKQATQ